MKCLSATGSEPNLLTLHMNKHAYRQLGLGLWQNQRVPTICGLKQWRFRYHCRESLSPGPDLCLLFGAFCSWLAFCACMSRSMRDSGSESWCWCLVRVEDTTGLWHPIPAGFFVASYALVWWLRCWELGQWVCCRTLEARVAERYGHWAFECTTTLNDRWKS